MNNRILVKPFIPIFILVGLLAACSNDANGGKTFSINPQTSVVEPSYNSTLESTTQVSTQAAILSQPKETLQITIPVSTPALRETKPPTKSVTSDLTSQSSSDTAIISDHSVIGNFTTIPLSYLATASETKTLFKHQSTGDNIEFLGLQCLAGLHDDPSIYPHECSTYAQNPYSPYDNRQWNWEIWADTTSDAIFKTDQWVSVVNDQQSNYQVLGMKYCYVDSWNLDFDYYRQKMEDLERSYPHKKFIWATTVLPAQSEMGNNLAMAENIQIFNQKLRDYAIVNNKILYDLAAIESHDPNGNYCQSNNFEALCDVYYEGYGGGGGGHPNVDGSIRLAKGFWWLMARISGWDGNP